MRSFRVGLNKAVAVLLLATAGLQLFTFTLTGKQMYLLLGGMMALVGLLYLTGPAFQIDVFEGGRGEVLLKNPLGMTLAGAARSA